MRTAEVGHRNGVGKRGAKGEANAICGEGQKAEEGSVCKGEAASGRPPLARWKRRRRQHGCLMPTAARRWALSLALIGRCTRAM